MSTPTNDPVAIADVLKRTRATLRNTELALEDLKCASNNERRVAALRNVIVMGRAVTNVLQNLRSNAQDFDIWYALWQEQMKQDPLMKYMYNLRSEILKEGKDRSVRNVHINSFRPSADLPPAPPNARGFFIGDENNGTGWEVQLEDGTIQKIYVELPADQVRLWLSFDSAPKHHLGSPIDDDSVDNLCCLFVQFLRRIVDAAEERFGKSA